MILDLVICLSTTFAIGKAGAANAALFAAAILMKKIPAIGENLEKYRQSQTEHVLQDNGILF